MFQLTSLTSSNDTPASKAIFGHYSLLWVVSFGRAGDDFDLNFDRYFKFCSMFILPSVSYPMLA